MYVQVMAKLARNVTAVLWLQKDVDQRETAALAQGIFWLHFRETGGSLSANTDPGLCAKMPVFFPQC